MLGTTKNEVYNISSKKSILFMAGIVDLVKETILDQFCFDSGVSLVRYMGLPLLKRRMIVEDYNPFLEKIRGKLRCWTARYLSFVERL